MKDFYVKNLYTKVSELYYNPKTQFQSYFLSFESGSLLEIMTNKHLIGRTVVNDGFAHLAMSVGTKIDLDNFLEKFLSEQ